LGQSAHDCLQKGAFGKKSNHRQAARMMLAMTLKRSTATTAYTYFSSMCKPPPVAGIGAPIIAPGMPTMPGIIMAAPGIAIAMPGVGIIAGIAAGTGAEDGALPAVALVADG
jgi:hypothetical protein